MLLAHKQTSIKHPTLDYQSAIDYIYSYLPTNRHTGKTRKTNLSRMLQLCEALGNPHEAFRSIHVGGTNGKGSTSHALAAVLQAAGYKTGLYTSPHLQSFRERMRINGLPVEEDYVVWFISQYKSLLELIKPSYFEISVIMAYVLFARAKVDIAVIEVGMGGKLDATNVITPEVSVITNISLDHTNLLGKTLSDIAREKAGIIKPNIPVIIGSYHPETMPVFKHAAQACRVPIQLAPASYTVTLKSHQLQYLILDIFKNESSWLEGVYFSLPGLYQLYNIPAILNAIEVIRDRNFIITESNLREGLGNIQQLTGLRGRWEVLSNSPLTICDTGHNEASIQEVVQQLKTLHYAHLHIIWSMTQRSEWLNILRLLPKEANYYFCQTHVAKSINAYQIAEAAAQLGLRGRVIETVEVAYQQAKSQATQKDVIFIGGSTYLVAELLSSW